MADEVDQVSGSLLLSGRGGTGGVPPGTAGPAFPPRGLGEPPRLEAALGRLAGAGNPPSPGSPRRERLVCGVKERGQGPGPQEPPEERNGGKLLRKIPSALPHCVGNK